MFLERVCQDGQVELVLQEPIGRERDLGLRGAPRIHPLDLLLKLRSDHLLRHFGHFLLRDWGKFWRRLRQQLRHRLGLRVPAAAAAHSPESGRRFFRLFAFDGIEGAQKFVQSLILWNKPFQSFLHYLTVTLPLMQRHGLKVKHIGHM